MRFAFLSASLLAGLSLAALAPASAAPPRNAIDFDASAPTLGELLDREAREAAARRAPPPRPEPPRQAPPADQTGSIPPRRVTQEPQLPRNAVTVILPHPRKGAGRPVPIDEGAIRR
jgi:hypothetical protein